MPATLFLLFYFCSLSVILLYPKEAVVAGSVVLVLRILKTG